MSNIPIVFSVANDGTSVWPLVFAVVIAGLLAAGIIIATAFVQERRRRKQKRWP